MAFVLPPAQALPELPEQQQIEVLDHLFEPCPTLQRYLLPRVFREPFHSYRAFIEGCREFLMSLLTVNPDTDPRIGAIIAAHPRLGAPKKGEMLSEHSSAEQKSLQGSGEEQQRLAALNEAYERKFPGLRYVVFVNGRSREDIMKNMEQRIDRGDVSNERVEAFNAMCDIAIDRAKKLGAKL